MNKILLVVTPTLGKSGFLNETIRSLQCFHANVYYAITSPASAKNAIDVAMRSVKTADFNWRFIEERSSGEGLYAALNQSIQECVDIHWDYLTYVNDDDLFGTEFKAVLDAYMLLGSRAFGYGKVSLINNQGHRTSSVPIESNSRWFEALLAQGISPLNQQGMIIPRALWEKLGGFRTEYKLCADLDFWLRAHRMGWPFKYYPLEVGQFRIREGQLSGDTKKLEAEIAAVVARDAPRKIGAVEKLYARWQFRIKNLPIYFSRFINGRRIRGMKMLAGK